MTGTTAFVTAGYLVFAIMTDNGGSPESQLRWQEATQNSVSFNKIDKISYTPPQSDADLGLDRTVTGSIRNIADNALPKTTQSAESELTVLELIRKNSDVSPSVSTGTDRVSVTVKKGDTLFGLSKRHGIDVEELASLNGLEQPYTIQLGQTLYIAR